MNKIIFYILSVESVIFTFFIAELGLWFSKNVGDSLGVGLISFWLGLGVFSSWHFWLPLVLRHSPRIFGPSIILACISLFITSSYFLIQAIKGVERWGRLSYSTIPGGLLSNVFIGLVCLSALIVHVFFTRKINTIRISQ